MSRKKTPPAYGESSGPMMVACQWNISSPTGPAEQFEGGSFPRSTNSCGKIIGNKCEKWQSEQQMKRKWPEWSPQLDSPRATLTVNASANRDRWWSGQRDRDNAGTRSFAFGIEWHYFLKRGLERELRDRPNTFQSIAPAASQMIPCFLPCWFASKTWCIIWYCVWYSVKGSVEQRNTTRGWMLVSNGWSERRGSKQHDGNTKRLWGGEPDSLLTKK